MNLAIVGRLSAAVLALVGSGVVGWRVLAPAEVLAPATDPYPAAPARAAGVTGQTPAMPLLVEGRVRVYASARQVRADAPVDALVYGTPRWSFRRWPEQVDGVVAVGPTVISRWSDGELVALDARGGTLLWRADGPPGGDYAGRRTGASVVQSPAGLHTARGSVVVAAGRRLLVLDAATGAVRHRADLPDGCDRNGFTTTGGAYVCGTTVLDPATGRTLPLQPDATAAPGSTVVPGPTAGRGAVATPLGCAVGRSGCDGMRDGQGRGWLTTGLAPRRAAALDPPGSTAAGDLALTGTGTGEIVASSAATGAVRWRRAAPAGDTMSVLAAQPGAVHLLTGGRVLVTVDAATGVPRSQFVLNRPKEQRTWTAGSVQAAAGFVAVERLRTPPDPAADDLDYYFTVNTVILAAT